MPQSCHFVAYISVSTGGAGVDAIALFGTSGGCHGDGVVMRVGGFCLRLVNGAVADELDGIDHTSGRARDGGYRDGLGLGCINGQGGVFAVIGGCGQGIFCTVDGECTLIGLILCRMDDHLVYVIRHLEVKSARCLTGAQLEAGITLGIACAAVELGRACQGQGVVAVGVGIGRGDVGAVVVGSAAVFTEVEYRHSVGRAHGSVGLFLGRIGLGFGGEGRDLAVQRRAGGGHHAFGNLAAEKVPCKLGVIDEGVAVALDALHHLVTTHFPCVHGVHLAPSQKDVHAFEYFGHVGSAPIGIPADVNVQDDAGHVALDVVMGLVKALGFAIGLIAAGGIDPCLCGTDVVEVGTATARIVSAQALGPDVLAVASPGGRPIRGRHAVACVERGGVGGVVLLTVHAEDVVAAIGVGGDILVGVGHQKMQG